MRIQLVGGKDPSVDGDGSALSRWEEYVDTYVMDHPTEWMPNDGNETRRIPVFLRR
jgi:paired amphipathic helix protein Sin3a